MSRSVRTGPRPVLLLVGAGHAHLHLVKRAADLIAAGYRVRLLAPRFFGYSGVASATAAGVLAGDAGRINVQSLADAAGVEFCEGTLTSLDLRARVATTSDGAFLMFDVLSLNIGSVVDPVGMHIDPTVLRVKPLSGLAELDARLRSRAPDVATVAVVGGGGSGVELAAHLSVRSDVAQVRLVDSATRIGGELPGGARKRLLHLLAARGVTVHTGRGVREVGDRHLFLDDGNELSYDLALLATGLTAPPLLAPLGLGDRRGVPVRATLQHVDHDNIYAVGDCAHFLPRPLPRVGVHGVRQGPVLFESLLARLRHAPLPIYEPQRRALSILDLSEGAGLAVWGRWWWFGAVPLRLKRWIDQRWLSTYQDQAPGARSGAVARSTGGQSSRVKPRRRRRHPG